MGLYVTICPSAWGGLKLGQDLVGKKATVSHECSGCGKVDLVEVEATRDGLDFGENPESGFLRQCPWSNK